MVTSSQLVQKNGKNGKNGKNICNFEELSRLKEKDFLILF